MIHNWLSGFGLDGWIHEHVAIVFQHLPDDVRRDLMDDPGFVLFDYDPSPLAVMHVPMKFQDAGRPGRSVVLKRTIKRRPIPFARWVIAHELAHAFLRHGGRFPAEDPEQAADHLAAEWGFPKPLPPGAAEVRMTKFE